MIKRGKGRERGRTTTDIIIVIYKQKRKYWSCVVFKTCKTIEIVKFQRRRSLYYCIYIRLDFILAGKQLIGCSRHIMTHAFHFCINFNETRNINTIPISIYTNRKYNNNSTTRININVLFSKVKLRYTKHKMCEGLMRH